MNEAETKLAKDFEKFIDGQHLKYFSGHEFTWYWDRARNGVKNTVPSPVLWQNIVPTLRILNLLRTRVGSPLYMTSTYRSPNYNKAIDGATFSQHTVFKAIDFYSEQVSPKRLHQYLTELRQSGIFKGGLGLYKTFVHIDTRGHNADWKGTGV